MDHPQGLEGAPGGRCHPVSAQLLCVCRGWGLTRCDSSDFENKFVCGEIMSYEDLHEHGSEAAVKAAGKLKQQGKTYESASSRFMT